MPTREAPRTLTADRPTNDSAPAGSIADALRRIRREYEEMPGLCLTARQAQRLWRLDPSACEALLGAMVASGFLRHGRAGYVRA